MTMESTVPATDTTDAAGYPLDPLTGAEIVTAATVIGESEYATPTLRFVMIQLAEPAKPAALTFTSDDDVPREAFVTMYDPGAKMLYEATVDVRARLITSWTPPIPGKFPSYLVEWMTGVEEKVREDPPAGRRPCANAASPTSTWR